ncbi:unnamed protein product [Choristocarpus tenellus]
MKTAIALLVYGNAVATATTFKGEATYYDYPSAGNCAIRHPIPGMYDGKIPMALNGPQYGHSQRCGACVRGKGTGKGSGNSPITGVFEGYIMDKCPECKHSDLDFGMGGDGRWEIEWEFVKCKGSKPTFLFEGSNSYYIKVQPRGMSTPAKKVKIDGIKGTRTQDNFFEVHNGAGFPQEFKIMVKTRDGKKYKSKVSLP